MSKDMVGLSGAVVAPGPELGDAGGRPGGSGSPPIVVPPAAGRADQVVQAEPARPPMARPYAAAGALFFDETGRILLVEPSYKPGWDIPGGFVEPGESPYSACVREVDEELGINPPIGGLLVVDWAPGQTGGWLDSEMLLFVFDGGLLSESWQNRIQLDMDEIINCAFVPVAEVGRLLPKPHARRVRAAANLREAPRPAGYLEIGQQVPVPGVVSWPAVAGPWPADPEPDDPRPSASGLTTPRPGTPRPGA